MKNIGMRKNGGMPFLQTKECYSSVSKNGIRDYFLRYPKLSPA